MEYEEYEFLNEEVKDIKEEFPKEYNVSAMNLGGSDDLFPILQNLQSKLDDLDEKIEQKHNSLCRKQEVFFSMVTSKLNWIQKNMVLNKSDTPSTVTRTNALSKAAVSPLVLSRPPVTFIPVLPTPKIEPSSTSQASSTSLQSPLKVIRVISTPLKKKMINITAINKGTKRMKPDENPEELSSNKKSCPETVKITAIKRLDNSVKKTESSPPPPPQNPDKFPGQFDPSKIFKVKPLIKNFNDMRTFENCLQMPSYRAEVLKRLKRLGGSSMAAEIVGVMRTLLSNVVQAHYTYQGLRRGKENFSKTQTWDVIRECIQSRYSTATVEDIKKVVMDMLRNAPARIKLDEFK